MRATFHNKLEVVQDFQGRKRIQYRHPFRLELDFFLEPKFKVQKKDARDWEVSLKTKKNQALARGVQVEVAGEFVAYLKRRVRGDLKGVTFKKLEELAKVRSIQ
ncbi:MAG: hypothetical protein H6853_09300 [Rhodospirillales bacterium]|nr:hypothetical protein [Alphaproteobacteria bacterium]USO03697.1 MAG: hypothetical protein H6853_09300 [Rhodospirillales bacterium]